MCTCYFLWNKTNFSMKNKGKTKRQVYSRCVYEICLLLEIYVHELIYVYFQWYKSIYLLSFLPQEIIKITNHVYSGNQTVFLRNRNLTEFIALYRSFTTPRRWFSIKFIQAWCTFNSNLICGNSLTIFEKIYIDVLDPFSTIALDSKYPTGLDGIISKEEFSKSIMDINQATKPDCSWYLLRSVIYFLTLIILFCFITNVILAIQSGPAWLIGYVPLSFVSLILVVLNRSEKRSIAFKYRPRMEVAIIEESRKYSSRSVNPCIWRSGTKDDAPTLDQCCSVPGAVPAVRFSWE